MKGTIKGKVYLGLMMLFAMTLWLAGCSASKDSGDKVRDLDFTVAGDMDVPDELKNLIAEKQQQPLSPLWARLWTMEGKSASQAAWTPWDLLQRSCMILLQAFRWEPSKRLRDGSAKSYNTI